MDYKIFMKNDNHHPYARTLPELLEYTAKNSENGFTFHSLKGTESFYSYKELLEKAKVIAGSLKRGNVDNVVLLCIDDDETFFLTLWGCIIAGIPSSPIEPLRSNEIKSRDYSRLINIINGHKKCTVITDEANVSYYQDMMNVVNDPQKNCISSDKLNEGEPIEPCRQDENDCIIIMYSSGSTGNPKGIKITHRNIMYALAGIVISLQLNSKNIAAMWAPHFHNIGLYINMIVMQIGASVDIFHPAYYIQNPTGFFNFIYKKKTDITVSNNFGLEWAIKNVNRDVLDKNCLKSVNAYMVGSEVISENTLLRFEQVFSEYGLHKNVMKPAYGLTEAVLIVTLNALDQKCYSVKLDENDTPVVSNGKPIPGLQLQIEDKERNILPDGKIGKVMVKAKSVTSGYINSDESCCTDDGWLDTGDLGFMEDGNLFISGREKEMFIVRGHNYMIHDIEHEIAEAGGIPNDCISVNTYYENSKNEEVIVLFTTLAKNDETFTILEKISDKMLAKYGFTADSVVFLDEFCRTGSGKIDRNTLINKFKLGEYNDAIKVMRKLGSADVEKADMNKAEDIIADIWSKLLEIDKSSLDLDIPFYEYGGDSVKQYKMMAILNNTFGLQLQPTFFRKCTTISEISEGIRNCFPAEENDDNVLHKNLSGDIAVTGYSFRLPGADDREQLWDILTNSKSMIAKVSDERKKLSETSDWEDWLGELKGIDLFDAEFFDISDNEAIFMDPQQRLILENAYEALEDSGEAIIRDTPKNVGVYSAIDQFPYIIRIHDYLKKNGIEKVHENALVSNLMNISAARISHFFNFNGPAVAMDSACSSFLTALHTARRAIQAGDISAAVVSTVHVIVEKDEFILSNKAGILSKSGRSKVFDKDADGSVFGEGVISVFIESLETAIKNKKHIYGIIKGSAINNDGYALSIMAPNSDGQYDVLKRAYNDAGISPDEITYLEAHGTGTKIGDPIELHALVKLYSEYKKDDIKNKKIGIGSIKSNIGHLLPAASGAGFVKLLSCFEHKMLVPGANFETVNPALKIGKTPFFVVTEPVEWEPENGGKRIAGITSLGLGGTNAHMILEEGVNKAPEASSRFYPLIISAKSREALDEKIVQLKNHMNDRKDSIGDICYTSCCGRMSFNYRAACCIDTSSISESFEKLQFSEYSKIRSMPVCIEYGQRVCDENSVAVFKKCIDNLSPFFSEKAGIIVNNNYYPEKAVNSEGFYDTLKDTENAEDAALAPKKAVRVCIGNSVDSDLSLDALESRDKVINAIIGLYLKGADIRWEAFEEFADCGITSLPKYPFKKVAYWLS